MFIMDREGERLERFKHWWRLGEEHLKKHELVHKRGEVIFTTPDELDGDTDDWLVNLTFTQRAHMWPDFAA